MASTTTSDIGDTVNPEYFVCIIRKFLFVYFVHGGFRTKIQCIRKAQSKSENAKRLAAVRKFHAYERSEIPRIRKFSAYEIIWIYSTSSSSKHNAKIK